jgi:hypothetical protein
VFAVQESKRAKDVALLLEKAAKEIPAVDMEVLARVYGLQGQQPMKRTVSQPLCHSVRHLPQSML